MVRWDGKAMRQPGGQFTKRAWGAIVRGAPIILSIVRRARRATIWGVRRWALRWIRTWRLLPLAERSARLDAYTDIYARHGKYLCNLTGAVLALLATAFLLSSGPVPKLLALLGVLLIVGAAWHSLGWKAVEDFPRAISPFERVTRPMSLQGPELKWADRVVGSLAALIALVVVAVTLKQHSNQVDLASGPSTSGDYTNIDGQIRDNTGIAIAANRDLGCGKKYMLPDSADLATASGQAEIRNAWTSHSMPTSWAINEPLGESYDLHLTLTNVTQSNQHVELGNTVSMLFDKRKALPHRGIVLQVSCQGGSGGGGGPLSNYFLFPTVNLDRAASGSVIPVTYKSDGSFDLSPGDFVVFDVPFMCKEPGLYHATLEFPYTSASQSGTLTMNWGPSFACSQLNPSWVMPYNGDSSGHFSLLRQ